ncbi:hypothetical protein KC614_01730 [candidate division WWE3 bacterium]|uniref:Uncharacterized protein n=1 Tax=candidate division WWE3 bacterium TaxID=2053526 RepID=A0A955LJZ3_UNCKA|nr:hypothetical protein [candidate division WWE3 bacterium]
MNDNKTTLIIDIADDSVSGFLFRAGPERIDLINIQRYVRFIEDDKKLIEALQITYKGQYDELKIVDNRIEWFGNALRNMYPEGLTVGVLIDGSRTVVGASSYGRLYNTKAYDYGVGEKLDDTLDSLGLEHIKGWLSIMGRDDDSDRLMNLLGNRRLYRGLKENSKDNQTVLLGLIRLILNKVRGDQSFLHEDSVSFTKGTHRIVITGDIALELGDWGNVVLAVLDGIGIEGVWEIIVDTQSALIASSYTNSGGRLVLEEIGVQSLGSIIIPSHNYPWGEYLGEVQVDIGLSEDQVVELRSGEIVRLPLDTNVKGSIGMKVKPHITVTGYKGLEKINGGLVGLVLDVRGRPLPDISDTETYASNYRHWEQAVR